MWIFFWIFLSILVGAFASSKKRSGVGWFFLAMVISPLIAFIILLVLSPPSSTLKKCPNCAEEVKAEARVCRFCGYKFTEGSEDTSLSLQQQTEDSREKRIPCSDGNCIGVINEKGICTICGKKSEEKAKSGEEIEKDRKEQAEKRAEAGSQIKEKPSRKFSSREEYEKWKAERLKNIDTKDK